MTPGVPPSKPWLDGIKGLGIEEDHPNVVRILEILQKKEAGGEITIEECKEFHLLNEELLSAYDFLYGQRIQPTGELVCYPPIPSKERMAAAIDWMFEPR
jgi:hypothetical protein